MKILYKQNSDNSALLSHNITDCYFKELRYKNDYKIPTYKSHSHTEYEIHIIYCGEQSYEIYGKVYELKENQFVIIPPETKHKIISTSDNMLKYSITFNRDNQNSELPLHGTVNDHIINSINFISEEYKQKLISSLSLIENRVFEVITLLMRIAGYRENNKGVENSDNHQLNLAKHFISDNIERNLSVGDVASYCHFSSRQLTRIFVESEGISPAKYINNEKMNKISECIKNTDLSLKQISEQFSYNNEHYFNTSFKKHFGITPFAYRKMFGQ